MSALPGTTGRRRIYLMRHGHVDYFSEVVQKTMNLEGVPLTELGREQAIASGQALSHVVFNRVLNSGLPRTTETTRLVLAQQAQAYPEPACEPGLKEIASGTPMDVSSREEIAAMFTYYMDIAAEPDAVFLEGGERFTDAYARATQNITKLLAEPGWHTALIVAHEGINRLILGWMTGNGLKAIQSFEQDLACINILDFDMVPKENGEVGTDIQRKIIKAVNLTPYNFIKHDMNLTSLEFLFSEI